ncbi:MAG: phosphatidylinositol-specific phospholipase C/glycerophosphodiester phosphodiesterase family protein [Planctomycetaceae bacterium]
METKPVLTAVTLLLVLSWNPSTGFSPLCAKETKDSSELPARLENAHAHNDYQHDRPLLDAIDHGFASIEADVFPVEGQLLVAHTFLELSKDKTLEGLYLKPLREIAARNVGSVYGDGKPIILLVDIKTKGVETYGLLDSLLKSYDDIVSSYIDGEFREKAVTVIVSGDRPRAEIEKSNPRYAAIDGRLSDLEAGAPASLVPLISDNWGNHFKYRGNGEMPTDEREKLASIVNKCHKQGRRLRFWATPESTMLWAELKNAGVDLIGTDDLEALRKHHRK